MMINRRRFILAGGGLSAALALGLLPRKAAYAAASGQFEVNYTDPQWHQRLSAAQFHILREEGTEIPYSSPLNDEHRDGVFSCAGCDLPLFSSHTKFDSHTGWPSFYQPLEQAVAQRQDRSFGMVRDEVHCRRCGGHLGHVFDDGPQPTGLRYCMNGLALLFAPQKA
ncbi:Peptide methionine sulfoxide reductase MsrB [Serratia quinivorans]|nr:Peptide methionine sulfoxide reductase MsrB [Serratia quinivorans]CAI1700779.1 Peptide methionine sulfoxide reductase MsrB [Serratia quinivorans]